ncbi:hypothetical protein M0R45_026839 [Rubus argutus]|uniref:Reverse transcriptase zinc-binding domain-containing protein n=1 Tax=Rubus argutus TaxID=59490 RepID=A0AAW1WYK6_RUBAR
MNAEILPDMSYVWRSILAGRSVLSKGVRFQVGKGDNVSIWHDPWLPLPYSFKPFSLPIKGTENWKVGDLIDHDNHVWLNTMVSELFSATEAEIILKIPLSVWAINDRSIWHYDKTGIYNVKSGYHIAQLSDTLTTHTSSSVGTSGEVNLLWAKLWKTNVPPKVRAFIWCLLQGILPTRVALSKKFPLPDIYCCFCHS